PVPIITPTGDKEWETEKILDRRPCGHRFQYLVQWCRYSPGADIWLSYQELKNSDSLEEYNAMLKSSEDGRV
ncbi:uncharacterized protein BJ212DRAFT_1274889, partial [Suillus subaureus]